MADDLETISMEAAPDDDGLLESRLQDPGRSEIAGNRGAEDAEPAEEGKLAVGTQEEPLRAPGGFLETVIGTDDRVQIDATDKYPWRMIAALELRPRAPQTAIYIGTGWLIGRRTLLTAGHCVYSQSDFDGWIGRINVSPGRNGDRFPFGTVRATGFSTLAKWMQTSDPDYDIGCIHLAEPIGERTGWFKIASMTDAELANRLLNVSGYPGDRGNGRLQFHHKNRVLHPAARRIYYDIDTYGGQSGSPVWIQNSPTAEPVAVGIHAYGVGGTPAALNIVANSAPRLVPSLITTIRGWLAND